METGRTKAVTKQECTANVNRVIDKIDSVQQDVDEIKDILRGTDKRSGLVKDVNYLLNQSKTVTFIASTVVGIVASVITTWAIHLIFGT